MYFQRFIKAVIVYRKWYTRARNDIYNKQFGRECVNNQGNKIQLQLKLLLQFLIACLRPHRFLLPCCGIHVPKLHFFWKSFSTRSLITLNIYYHLSITISIYPIFVYGTVTPKQDTKQNQNLSAFREIQVVSLREKKLYLNCLNVY